MKKGLDENKVAVLTGKAIQDDNVFLVGFKDFFFTDIGTVKQCQYRHAKSTDAKEAIPGICIFFEKNCKIRCEKVPESSKLSGTFWKNNCH